MGDERDGADDLGRGLQPGSRHYRAFVGPPEDYDLLAALQFNLLTSLGLREHHHLLDIGCGSLRAGRLFIPYLLPGRYYGIEPESWLVEEGIARELGRDLVAIKRPTFSTESDFALSRFGRSFDFLLAQSIFSHAPASAIRRCLAEARRVMHSASVFAATFVEGKEDHAGTRWAYQGDAVTWTKEWERRGSVRYTFPFLCELAAEAGLVCRRLSWPHPRQRWIALVDPAGVERLPSVDAAAQPPSPGSAVGRTRRSGPFGPLSRAGARLVARLRRD
jgi:SAM-dependent methyltransferase